MFNKAWINLALLLIPVALIFDVPALLVIAALLLTTVPVAWWWARISLRGVTYKRALGERRAFAGEIGQLVQVLLNAGRWEEALSALHVSSWSSRSWERARSADTLAPGLSDRCCAAQEAAV